MIRTLLCLVFALSACEKETEKVTPLARVEPAPVAAPAGDGLAKRVDVALGDLVAERTVGMLRLKGDLDAPMSAYFDRKDNLVVVAIGGSRSTVEDAKETVELMRTTIQSEVKTAVSQELGYELSDKDFRVLYLNRNNGKHIVRWDKGTWVIP